MAMKFRKLSIRSRKRTLGLAGFALVVEMVVSHPRFDIAAAVAHVTRVAAPAMTASLATFRRTSPAPADPVPGAPAVVPISDHAAELCVRARPEES